MSNKLVFLVFRQQTVTIQGVLEASAVQHVNGSAHASSEVPKTNGEATNGESNAYLDGPPQTQTSKQRTSTETTAEHSNDDSSLYISEQMVRAVEHFPAESIVLVKGKITQPPQPVQNATIHNAEIQVQEIHLLSQLTEHVPFTVYDAENIHKMALKDREEHDSSDDDDQESRESSDVSSEKGARSKF
jgi:aspartyl-tRNA synthetase